MVGGMLLGAAVLCAASWLALRRASGAGFHSARLLALDAAPVALGWALLTGLTARPVLAALAVSALLAVLLRGTAAKLAVTGEPLVFTDWQMAQVILAPQLYAEVTTPLALATTMVLALALAAAAWVIEPAWWDGIWPAAAIAILALVLWRLRPPAGTFVRLLGGAGTVGSSGDVMQDIRRFGPLAAPVIHAAVAGLERQGRRQRFLPGRSSLLPDVAPGGGPVVLLQLESFFDVRTLGRAVPAGLLPQYDRCAAGSLQHGRLAVPAYGANTVRTEFQALTGMTDALLGLDRFNPYASFARVPLDSIAWRLRAAGYRTVCIHPFRGGFYGRDRVMPNLGFDRFIDLRGFTPAPGARPYVSDLALVDRIAALLRENGRRTFIFAVSIGNHSPWGTGSRRNAFAGFLAGLQETDAALGRLARTMQRDWPDGLLTAFGDHRPSFGDVPGLDGLAAHATDYVMLRPGLPHLGLRVPGRMRGNRQDIPACRLPAMVLQAAAAQPATALLA